MVGGALFGRDGVAVAGFLYRRRGGGLGEGGAGETDSGKGNQDLLAKGVHAMSFQCGSQFLCK